MRNCGTKYFGIILLAAEDWNVSGGGIDSAGGSDVDLGDENKNIAKNWLARNA